MVTQETIDAFRSAVARWPRVHRNEIDEVVSETLLQFAKVDNRERIAEPLRWLLCAASRVNKKFVSCRIRRIDRTQLEFDPIEVLSDESEWGESPKVSRVQAVLLELSAIDRQVVELCDFRDLSKSEVAQQLGLQYRTLQSKLRRAHERFRNLYVDRSVSA